MENNKKSKVVQVGNFYDIIEKIHKETGYSKTEIVRKGIKLLLETEEFKKFKEKQWN